VSGEQDVVFTFDPGNLPQDWQPATIGSLLGKTGIFVDGDWVESKDQDPDGDVRLIQLADIGDGEYRDRSNRFLTPGMARKLSCTLLEPGDLLIARMPDPLGRACIFPGDQKSSVTVVDVAVVRPKNPEVNTRWLMYCVNAPQFRRAVASLQSGSTRQRISRKNLAKITFPCPPRTVQDQLVAETEKQFSRLDEAVANLKRVKAKLKHYKAAVLKAAVEGRLVPIEAELARKEGRTYETGEQLLARILQERRAAWEKQNASNRKKKYNEPQPIDVSNLPELPEGWAWAAVEQAGRLQLGRQRAPKYHQGQNMRPYLRVQNVFEAKIDLADVMEMNFPNADCETYKLKTGDILLNEGQSPELLGRPAIYRGELPGACFTNTLVRFQAVNPLNVDYALIVFRHYMHSGRFAEEGAITTNIAHLSLGRLSRIEFPVPPLKEQDRIVAEFERSLSLGVDLEAQVYANLLRVERLRQTILQQTFNGGKP
jgi:type I restriction enzyme, S subunit